YDLCAEFALDPIDTKRLFRDIALKIVKNASNRYRHFEREWVLASAFPVLRAYRSTHAERARLYELENMGVPDQRSPEQRLENISVTLKRLPAEDLFLILCSVKHGLSHSTLASVMQKPEGSIELQERQALQALEEWIWKERVDKRSEIMKSVAAI